MERLIETRFPDGVVAPALEQGFAALAPQLSRLDRYERRALSRHKTAIGDFDRMFAKARAGAVAAQTDDGEPCCVVYADAAMANVKYNDKIYDAIRRARDQSTLRASLRARRMKSLRALRSWRASRVWSPCFRAFRLPLGAPDPGAPPCMRQRALPVTAGA